MKKIYLQPTTKVVVLKRRQQLLAGSPGVGINSSKSVNAGDVQASEWDFDEDDDF